VIVDDNTQSKVKEIKEKKIKGNKIKVDNGDKSPLYKNLIEIYFNVYEKKIGIKPAFSPTEGKHLKELISKLQQSIQNKSGSQATDQATEMAFLHLLEKLPKFYAEKLDIKIINSKYDGIIAEIRTKSGAANDSSWQDILDKRQREREEAAAMRQDN
jgi:hypothetical protein